MSNIAMFEGLVTDERGETVEVAYVGADACYVLDDGDFKRYVDSEQVDRQVLGFFKEQVDANRDIAVRGLLQFMGKDDIFSKTAVEYSLDRMEESVGQPVPQQAKEMLRSVGFQIIIDFHGDVIEVKVPSEDMEGPWE